MGGPGAIDVWGLSVMSKICRRSAIAALLCTAATVAVAADLPPQYTPPTAPPVYSPQPASQWTVTLGVEGRASPAWPGAPTDKYGFSGIPLFSIRKAGTPPSFFGPRDGFGFSIIDLGQFRLGPVAKIVWRRKESDYTELRGLGDLNYAIQAGGFVEIWPVQWLRLRSEVRKGFGAETGVTGDVFLDAVIPLGQLTVSGGPRLTVQSAGATSPYFSITAAQAAATAALFAAGSTTLPGLPVYNAGGGLYSYGAGAMARYFWTPQFATHTFVEYERLTGDAANSPLVTQRGSPNQFTFGAGATYSFDIPGLW